MREAGIIELRDAVQRTEAPYDLACSLVFDLMHYCGGESIDWPNDILSRARGRFIDESHRPSIR